jgi:hypothetical protein
MTLSLCLGFLVESGAKEVVEGRMEEELGLLVHTTFADRVTLTPRI